jgi:hypothetical protein
MLISAALIPLAICISIFILANFSLCRSKALIFIYETQGIVVKAFTDPEQCQNEISGYSVFSGQPGFSTLLAHGRSPPFILITDGGVSPPELSPVQL